MVFQYVTVPEALMLCLRISYLTVFVREPQKRYALMRTVPPFDTEHMFCPARLRYGPRYAGFLRKLPCNTMAFCAVHDYTHGKSRS